MTLKPKFARVLICQARLIVFFEHLQNLRLYLTAVRQVCAVREVQLYTSDVRAKIWHMNFLENLRPTMFLEELSDLGLLFSSARVDKPSYDIL